MCRLTPGRRGLSHNPRVSATGGSEEPRPVRVETVAAGSSVKPGDIPPGGEPSQPRAWAGPPATETVTLSAADGDAEVQLRVGAYLEVAVKQGHVTVTAAPLVLIPVEGRREGEDSWALFRAVHPGRATIGGTLRVGGPRGPGKHWVFEVTVHEVENQAR